jgi:dihydrodipicolinate synthase/N-acetylneuraminate lyase
MDFERAKKRLEGCYITVPTMFRDPDLELDLGATRRNVRFLLDRGIDAEYGTLLAGGAAGDFSTMTFDERVQIAEAVVAEAGAKVPVAMGAQTTSTRELIRLAKAAERVGAEFIQVSCPFYFTHTEEDFFEYVAAAAGAADIGIIIYNTFWTSAAVSLKLVERLAAIPNVVGLKWATPRTDAMEFEDVVSSFAERLSNLVREQDTVGRFSGDKFAVLLAEMQQPASAEVVARKVLEACRRPHSIDGRDLSLSCSIGISVFPEDAEGKADLLRAASDAVHAAKQVRHTWQRYNQGMHRPVSTMPMGLRSSPANWRPETNIASPTGPVC